MTEAAECSLKYSCKWTPTISDLLTVLKDHDFLVVGRQQISEGKTFMTAQIFEANGGLRARIGLSHDGTKTSNVGVARSTRVFDPIAINANGFVYVMRGTTNERFMF